MWSLWCIQGFFKIWPAYLVSNLICPIFKLVQEIIIANILTKFQDYWTENVASRVYTKFSLDINLWFSFWLNMTYFQSHPRFHWNSSEISSEQTFWPSFMSIWLKIWPLQRTQGFSQICPSDLVFDPTWPILEPVWYLIEAKILTKFHEYWAKNVASRAYTR